MDTPASPYNRPGIWLLLETSKIALFAMSAWAVAEIGNAGNERTFVAIILAAVAAMLTIRLVVDILVAGFCRWLEAVGHGLGVLFGAMRELRRGE